MNSLVCKGRVDWIGVRPALWVATVGALAGALWLLPSPVPALRKLPEQAA